MKKFDVITIGGATQDIMYNTKDAEIIENKNNVLKQKLIAFEYGAKINSPNVKITFGGGGMNTAVNFSRLGLKTGTFLNIGNDWIGELIVKELKNQKIDTQFIKKDAKNYSGFSFIINYEKKKDHVAFLHRGANENLELNKKDLAKINSKWIYLSSLSGKKALVQKNIKVLFENNIKNIRIAWNPGSSQLEFGYNFFKKYLPKVDVFNINKDEAIQLVLSSGKKITNTKELLKTISSWGPKITIITEGDRGASAYYKENFYFQKANAIKNVINTTGAGDAFGSTLVVGLLTYNNDLKKSLKLASKQSEAVIKKSGAQIGLLTLKKLTK